MGLPDYEERELAEIEQRLAEDDPRFVARLAGGKAARFALSTRARFILGVLTSYLFGLLIVIAGVGTRSVVLIAVGAIITASFPVALAARAWRDRPR